MSKLTEVRLPDIGDFDEVEIIEILVASGDTVEQEDSLITLESDKATMEIPSPADGLIKDILVAVGDKVAQGTVILMLEEQAETAHRHHSLLKRRQRPNRQPNYSKIACRLRPLPQHTQH